jgi:hypothetical protein
MWRKGAGQVAQVVERLHSKREAPSSNPSTANKKKKRRRKATDRKIKGVTKRLKCQHDYPCVPTSYSSNE